MLTLIERYWEFEGISGFDPTRLEPLLDQLLREPDRGLAAHRRTAGTE